MRTLCFFSYRTVPEPPFVRYAKLPPLDFFFLFSPDFVAGPVGLNILPGPPSFFLWSVLVCFRKKISARNGPSVPFPPCCWSPCFWELGPFEPPYLWIFGHFLVSNPAKLPFTAPSAFVDKDSVTRVFPPPPWYRKTSFFFREFLKTWPPFHPPHITHCPTGQWCGPLTTFRFFPSS